MRILVLLITLIPTTLLAQVQFSYNFHYAKPMGDMEFDSRRSFGWDATVGYRIPGAPIFIGAEFGQSQYASETRDYLPFIDPRYVHDVADITVKNRMSNYLVNLRIMPVNVKFVDPYIELLGGGATYYTKWYARDPWYNNDDNCEGYWDRGAYQRDHTYSYGGGFGVMTKLGDIFNSDDDCLKRISVDLGVRYLRGGDVDFLNVHENPDQFRYDSGYEVTPQNQNSGSGSGDERDGPNFRHGGHSSAPSSMDPLGWDVDANQVDPYTATHEWVQFRLGVRVSF